jgi:hypothetical protein
MYSISLVAVFVAAVVNFIIGFMMHGPIAGKLWMKLANITPTGNEKFSDMYGKMFWNLMVNLVTAYILGTMISFNGINSAIQGMWLAFFVWCGFILTGSSMDVIWMGKSYKLWLFEVFSSLLCMLAMGAILAAW